MSKRKFTFHLLVSLTVILFASCSGSSELGSDEISKSYINNTVIFQEIASSFKNDVSLYTIDIVKREIPSWANCNSFPCELPPAKWKKYKEQLDKIGCLWVEYKKDPERIYFIMYYKSFLMDARLKGIVYTEERNNSVSAHHPKQEWKKINDNWYVFTMMDN